MIQKEINLLCLSNLSKQRDKYWEITTSIKKVQKVKEIMLFFRITTTATILKIPFSKKLS